ncbi:hypothetical protein JCM11251_005994 [Rhodosporidiobolus azoricus]
MSTPRPHLLPSFDPGKAKIAELRGILLEHDIPYASNAKKADLVKLFEKHVRPQAATLLAQSSSVRPSTHGILDGESQSGSLHELDTDSEEEHRFEAEQAAAKKGGKGRKSVRGRKSLSEAIAALEKEKEDERAKGRTTRKQPSLAGKKGKGQVREPERESQGGQEEDELALSGEEEEEPIRHVSPKKRKAQDAPATPRLSTLVQEQQDSPFSDFNPFQSGGEETPGREVKRRKSSLGPERLKERKSQILGGRKSMPASSLSTSHMHDASSSPDQSAAPDQSAGGWATSSSSSPKKARKSELPPPVPPVPALKPSSFFAAPPTTGSGSRSAPASARKDVNRMEEDVSMGRKGKERTSAPAKVPEPEPEDEEEEEGEEEEEEEEHEDEEDVEMADEEPAYEYGAEEQAHDESMEDEEMALDDEPEPTPAPQARAASRPRASAGGTPLGQKYMVPVSKVKTTPPHIAEQLRQFESGGSATASSSLHPTPAKVQPQKQETRTISVQERHRLGRHSEPSSRNSPAVKKLLSQVGPAAETGSPAKGTPPRRSLPVAAERQLAATPGGRAAPAPPTPKNALREAIVFPSPRRRGSSPSNSTSTIGYLASSIPGEVVHLAKWGLLAFLVLYAFWYRQETLAAGFCDSSSSTAANTNALTSSRSLTGQTSLAFPSLPRLPPSILSTLDRTGVRPSCTSCPSHGLCTPVGLFGGCTTDYVPRPSLLRTLSLGLIPAAPRCEADTEKQVAVAKQAASAARVLRRRKGEVMCERRVERGRRKEAKALRLEELAGEEDLNLAEEAYVYGLEADGVMVALQRENEASGAPFPEDVFDEISRLALRDLDTHGEVIVWQNGDTFWYASKTADMSLSCRAKLAAIRSAKKHKLSLFGIFSTLAVVLWVRQKFRNRVEDKERVRQLVQAALRQLQQQERSHLTSPASFPYPHLAPSHLRDLLLTSVHSPSRRAELWRQVEKVVEGNANVRVGEVEVGGEEMRGWRWIGPTTVERTVESGQGTDGEGKEMVQVRGGVVGTPGKGTPGRSR